MPHWGHFLEESNELGISHKSIFFYNAKNQNTKN